MMKGLVEAMEGGETVIVLSRGNVDLSVVSALAERNESSAHRRIRFYTKVSDRLGGLAAIGGEDHARKLLERLGMAGYDVREVSLTS